MAKKLICLILLISCVICCLVGCGQSDGGNKKQGDDEIEHTGKGEDKFYGVDFEEEDITIAIASGGNKYISCLDSDKQLITDDTIVAAVKQRNDYVQSKLNLKVDYYYLPKGVTGNTGTYDAFMNLYNANDGFADSMVYNLEVMIQLMMSGIFRNALDDTRENFFDFNDGSWMKDAMQSATFEDDLSAKAFILASDYFLGIISSSNVVFFNETRLAETVGDDDAVSSFHSTIINGEWTYDYMNSLSKRAFENTGIDANKIDKEDKVGVSMADCSTSGNWGLCYTLTYSSTVDLIERTSSGYAYSTNLLPLSRLTDKVMALYDGKGTFLAKTSDESKEVFINGKALFYIGGMLKVLESEDFALVKSCPIPYPKVNDADVYVTQVSSAAAVGAIVKTGDFTPVSAYWQYSSLVSEKPKLKYYEDGLGLKYETGTDTSKMLSLIYENITFNRTYFWDMYIQRTTSGVKEAAYCMACSLGAQNRITSTWESMITQKTTSLNDVYKTWKSL